MEEPQNRITSGEDRSEKTAETLRTLRNLADQTLGKHRRRLSTIESSLNTQLQQIAEELARDHTNGEIETDALQRQHEELTQYRQSLSEAEEEIATLRNQLVTQSNEHEAERVEKSEQLQQAQKQSEQEKQEHQRLANEIQQMQEDLAAAEAEYQALCKQQTTESGEHETQVAEQHEELAKLKQQCHQGEAAIEQLGEELDESREQFKQTVYERDCLVEELQASQTHLKETESRPCEECIAGQQQISKLEQRQAEVESERQTIEQQFADIEEKWGQTRQSLEVSEANHEKVADLLRDAEQRLVDLAENTELNDELEQTQQKFELALADVEKLKRENAELSEELARRPEDDDHESPELVSLRSERDALASRVSELESAPQAAVDADAEQEVADLHRRFELAVEDVRELKQENADLRAQVEAAPSVTPASQDTGGLDWQAQKARLLAELDAEEGGGAIAPKRSEDRATIEGTISITDSVVAEKDREIADLQSQLENPEQETPTNEEVQQTALAELFDKDEVIQAERTRLEEVQHEWEEKLRGAELELSVQRATIAREQASLEEKLAQLEEQKSDNEATADGKPRRRWLSALGLKDDEDE